MLAIVMVALAVANLLGMILLIVYDLTSGVRAHYRQARDLDSIHRGLMGILSIMRHSDLGRMTRLDPAEGMITVASAIIIWRARTSRIAVTGNLAGALSGGGNVKYGNAESSAPSR
jgi:hypothetical protein